MSYFQLGTFILIIVALVIQHRLLKSGKLKPIKYTVKKRLAIAFGAALPLCLFGAITDNAALIFFGMASGFICFIKKDWHSWGLSK